ncbi:Por secretion system C-terminal sorting domain-containing protein [Formosa sp. Hel1_31_208]|uniref:T9SS type A sorting domain-containing protein n=1 Tax=Formosa sp. Hel1_31_208 TaxID=1798225 RepID=UPI00087D2AB9|nr:T9SS type A sorting domain-containing protein [Formosa sp. Hel1_31_208]SDS53483.1 Por secretion system C-terminal sorting domain-containing protein [Formosa sp. Hel1_31_208]
MKKITLSLLFVFSLVFTTESIAQVLNQTANWTNGSWTTSGTFTPAGLLNDPATDGFFTFDDDAAGNGSADTVQSESPVIDLGAAAFAGETFVEVSGNFVYRPLGGDVLSIEYWDADAASWVNFAVFGGNSTNTDYQTCVGTAAYTSPPIDISGFTPTQLSGFKYRFAYDDLTGWQWGWCFDPPTITSATPPTCDVVVNVTVDALTPDMLDFSWDAPLAGTPVSYDWEVVTAGGTPGIDTVVSGSETAPDQAATTGATLTPEIDYDLYIVTNCGGVGTATFGPAAFTTPAIPPPPPGNDDACDAIAVAVGSASSGQAYTNEGGTIEANEVGGTCWFTAGDVSNSVWFTFTIAATTDVTVSTDIAGGSLGDTQIAVYTATDCSDLLTFTEIGCDDDSGTGLLSIAALTGLAPGTYYIQIEGFGTGTGTFDLSVTDPTLGVNQFEEDNGFTYFPNPVKNELTLNAQKDIQNVAIYNMLGQEVLRTAPNTIRSVVDMNGLSQGAYFVQVTIDNVTETVRIIKQ